ncbi:MAG: selenium-dependent molybdenum cofactor biosynthesis protein YqeB [Candidatus Promineifilaceae bacterium]|nr:selenium-dependent molybdenum cofactor biosynthesis protein YqeB [Candidatus Promineifilaceae bacterium]
MDFRNCLVIVRGGGDLGTGVIYRLAKSGFPVIVLELPHPLVVRRSVALATAVLDGEIIVEDLHGLRIESADEALRLAYKGKIPILIAPELQSVTQELQQPPCALIDARMAKRNIDTNISQAPLVIALGPGFCAGVDCHAVIETMRGHRLGRVIWQGSAIPNTGTPGLIAGKGVERVLRAPADGAVSWQFKIGDRVQTGDHVGSVAGQPIPAPFDGVIRGLIAPSTPVKKNLKIGDVDARADRSACFTISDKALAIGGGVLEALLTYLSQQSDHENGAAQ